MGTLPVRGYCLESTAMSNRFSDLRRSEKNAARLAVLASESYLRKWRRGWDSNPRMEVLQTSPLGHLGTAPLFSTAPRHRR
jgi:hypothetical protein